MSADPNKQVVTDTKGSTEVQPPKSDDSKTKGEGQGATTPDLSKFISKDDYEKATSERDGTISALQKKIDTLTSGLNAALGIDDKKGSKPVEELVTDLQNQLQTLQGERNAERVSSAVRDALDDYKDDDGKTLTPEAKKYLMKRISNSGLALDKVSETVKAEISEFQSVFGASTEVPTVKDGRPQARTSSTGRNPARPKTANEILETGKTD